MPGIRDLPGFRESLRLLIEREQYAMVDIAAMFNVSRERIRQVCELEKLDTHDRRANKGGLFHLRVWVDSENRFVPVSRGLISEAERLVRSRSKRDLRNWYRSEVRNHVVAALLALQERVGGAPVTSAAAWYAVSGERVRLGELAAMAMAQAWFGSSKKNRVRIVARAKRELSALTGIVWREVGRPGHTEKPSEPAVVAPDPHDPYTWTPWVPPFHKVNR